MPLSDPSSPNRYGRNPLPGDILSYVRGKWIPQAPVITDTGFPIGALMEYAGASAPPGPGLWTACNGSSQLRLGTFAALFGVIGTRYGAVDGSHFTLPDLRDRVTVGSGGSLASPTGGAGTHTMIAAELPPHNHTPDVAGNFAVNIAGGTADFVGGANYTIRSVTGNGPGTSQPFSVQNPYTVIFKYIRYG